MSSKAKVGIFLIGGIVLFGVGLFFIGSSRQLFSHHFQVYAEFEKVGTLQPGATVRVSGMNAGEMTNIRVPSSPSGRFRMTLNVDQKFHPLIRKDSVVTIEAEGMVGSKYLEIGKGSEGSPECPAGGTLPTKAPIDLSDLMRQGSGIATTAQSTIQDLQKHADAALQNIADLAGHADSAVVSVRGDVKRMADNGARMTADAAAIAANVRQGRGAAGKLLADKDVSSNVANAVSNAKQATANIQEASRQMDDIMSEVQQQDLANVQKTLENTQSATGQIDQAVGTLLSKGNHQENTAEALADTVHAARQTMTNLADDTEAVKHNFFLRGFFKRRGFYNFSELTPGKYAGSEFVKKPKARVWLVSPGLFQSGSDGKQQLAKDGPAILDQAMSDLVPYLPHNPIVVEGYSDKGAPEERFQASRDRASQVRDYLISHFHLEPKMVGVMPLEDRPPKGVNKTWWDGVCLVLVSAKR